MSEEIKALVLKVEGSVVANTFDEFKQQFIKAAAEGFAYAIQDEEGVKLIKDTCSILKAGEDAVSEAKRLALESTADIKQVFTALDEFSAQIRSDRLALEKKYKGWYETEKMKIASDGKKALGDMYKALFEKHPFYRNKTDIDYTIIDNAFRNRKNLTAMRNGVKEAIESEQQHLNELDDLFTENKKIIDAVYAEAPHLFPDYAALLLKETETLSAIVGQRKAEYEVQKRKEEEKRKAEEERKAQEAESKRIAEAKAAEERAKAEAAAKAQALVQPVEKEPEQLSFPAADEIPESQPSKITPVDDHVVERITETVRYDGRGPVPPARQKFMVSITIEADSLADADKVGEKVHGFLNWKGIKFEKVEVNAIVTL